MINPVLYVVYVSMLLLVVAMTVTPPPPSLVKKYNAGQIFCAYESVGGFTSTESANTSANL